MKRSTRVTTLVLAATALGFTGCFRLARKSPPVELYVLGGAPIEEGNTAVGAAEISSPTNPGPRELSIGLRRLDLAPYLATLAIVVRRADNEIVTTGFQRWAEGPTTGVNRAVSAYIAGAAGIRSVDVAPWPIRADHDYLLQMHVTRLEGVVPSGGSVRTGEAHLLAHWEIVRPNDGVLLARGLTDYRALDWSVDDYVALVTRLDRGLIKLSRDIVSCLQRLGALTPPAVGVTDAPETVECVSREP